MATLVGQAFSHYRILERLGGGGMGVVYKAEDIRLKRTVALKFLPPELTCDPEAKERFVHEAQAASTLQHNNICVVHDIDDSPEGQMFICMEYLDGETLKKKIERGPLKVDEAIDITVQIAQGLAKAHEHGIVHRDIKPANVMVTTGRVAKIVDFGLAKLSGQAMLTKTGSTLGTAAYMSPEQARGETVDHRTDIWSLGVVLYQLLTGNLPFRGEFEQGLIYSILNEKPRPLDESQAHLPAGLSPVVYRALEKQPSDRYSNVQGMIDDLMAIGEARQPRRVRSAMFTKPIARKAIIFGAIALVVLGAAAILFLPNESTTPPGPVHQLLTRKTSIAVLPFTDLSPGKDQEYFCSGIAEELTSALAQIPDLKVVSRTRAFSLSKDATDLKDMGKQLGVATLLDGSVRKDGNRLRIRAQLIDAADGSHIWTDTYDRTLQDIFAIQKEVARSVVATLQITLSPQTAWIESRQSANVEAYEHWLRGSHFVRLYLISNNEQDIQSAIHHYEAAVSLDSTYALAYGGMAWAYEHRYVFSGRKNRIDRDQAVRCTLKGYQLDSLSGSLNAGMGYLACMNDEYDMAYHFFTIALTLEPRSLVVNHLAGEFLSSIGLIRQSERFYEAAIALDPYYLFSNGEAADALECEAEWERADAYYRRVLQFSPNDRIYRAQHIVLLIKTGRMKEAADLLTEAMKDNPDFMGYARCRALIHAAHGEQKQALKLRKDPEVYALLGMKDEALRLLEEHAGKGDYYQYVPLTSNPFYSSLHSDPRFQAILSRVEREYRERMRKYADLGSKAIGRQ